MARARVRGKRAYKVLLRAYPAAFREEYGRDMVQLFEDRARERGAAAWRWALRDLLVSAPRLRWEEAPVKTWGIGFAAFIVAAAVGAMVTGTDSAGGFAIAGLITLPALAIVGLLPLMLGRRFARGSETVYGDARGFTWWLVPAAALGALEVATGIRLLNEDVKPENVAAAIIFGCFAAAVFGGVWLRARGRNAGNALIASGVLAATVTMWSVVPAILVLVVIVSSLAEIGASSSPRRSNVQGAPH